MSEVKKVPNLTQKGHSYYFRIRVPKHVLEAYGRREVTQALGRVSQPQAAIKARELAAHYTAQFQTQLHELGIEPTAPAAPALPKRVPTMVEAVHIAQEGARELLARDELARSQGARSAVYDVWGSMLADLDDEVTEAISGASMGPLFKRFEADLKAHGLTAPKDRDELRQMVYKWATTYGKALQHVQQRVKGVPVETPEPQQAPASLKAHREATTDPGKKTADALKLVDIFALWRDNEPNRPPKTVRKAELAVKRFEEVMGNPAIGSLTRADGMEYRRKLIASEMSNKSAGMQLTWVHVLLNFEADNYQRITANPWKKLVISDHEATKREEWKDAQAVKLFSHPLFQNYELPTQKNAGKDAAYWCPLIGAYTGARVTEIAQLLIDDIAEIDGLWCFRIAITEPDWQRLKGGANGPSKRFIPIHLELIRLGILDYARDMRTRGTTRLFPALAANHDNNAGGPMSGWFGKFKADAGFGPENTFHGWRNTIETKLQRAREGQLYIDRYIGHKPEGMGAGTYARVQPSDLVATASQIAYEGLKLPRVYKTPVWTVRQ